MPGERSSTWIDRRAFGGNDEGGVDAPLLQLLGGLEAGQRHQMVAGLDLVGAQQLLRQLAHAGTLLADGDALATQVGQAIEALFAAVEDPDRLVEDAAQRQQAGIVLAVRIVRQFDDAALDEADLGLVVLQALDVLQRAGRGLDLERDAVARQDRRVAVGELVIGAGIAAGGDDDFVRRRRLDELVGDVEADADDQENPPRGGEQVAQRQQAGLESCHHGSRMVEPVVLRASRSRCAWAASLSG